MFSEPGKVGVMLQRVLRSRSKKFASFSTVSQSGGDMRLNHVVYSKYPRPGMTEVIPNEGLEVGNLCFGQWGSSEGW